MMGCHDARGDIFVQSNHPPCRFADREAGPRRDGRQDAFKPFPANRELCGHDGKAVSARRPIWLATSRMTRST